MRAEREPSAAAAHLPGVARLEERLAVLWIAIVSYPLAARPFRVELSTEQDRDVAEPEPDQEHDDCRERPVGLVVRPEVGDVQREQRGGQEPYRDCDGTTHEQALDADVPHV